MLVPPVRDSADAMRRLDLAINALPEERKYIRGCGHIGDVVVSWRRNQASANPLARHERNPA